MALSTRWLPSAPSLSGADFFYELSTSYPPDRHQMVTSCSIPLTMLIAADRPLGDFRSARAICVHAQSGH